MKNILILGAGGPAAYNFIDSLNWRGESPTGPIGKEFKLFGMDTSESRLRSAPVDERVKGELNFIVEEYSIDLIVPQPDAEVLRVAEKFPNKALLPTLETVNLCQDKWECAKKLMQDSVPVALTVPLSHAFITFTTESGPSTWLRARRGAGSTAAIKLGPEQERLGKEWIKYWGLDFIASEYLPGKEFAFQSLWNRGELVTSAARQRCEYILPSHTGQSSSPSLALSVHDDRVNEIATKAIRAVSDSPHGVFCVDLKEDTAGDPKVTEINAGRFFTTSNFFTRLGCNMPLYYVKLGLGEKVTGLKKYNGVPAGWEWLRAVDREPILRRAK